MKWRAPFQQTLAAQMSFEKYARRSRREKFLSVMDVVVAFCGLKTLIEPDYPKADNGHQPADPS
jgi:IS5 family transposase